MTTEIQMTNIIANSYTSMIFLNLAVFISGICIILYYNPINYGCDPMYISKKLLLGIYISIIAFINLMYLMSFPPL